MISLSEEVKNVYVGPRMGTDSFCVMSLPICEILAVPARLHTGSPEMRKGVGFDLYPSHERKGARTWGKGHAGPLKIISYYFDPRTRIVIPVRIL